jgi:hypothetical protein
MTLEQQARLRALAEAATPGPWRMGTPGSRCKLPHFPHGRGECAYTFDGYDDDPTSISMDVDYGSDDIVVNNGLVAGQWDYEEGGIVHAADAAYIAAVRPVYADTTGRHAHAGRMRRHGPR